MTTNSAAVEKHQEGISKGPHSMSLKQKQPPDGGWGWMVLTGCVICGLSAPTAYSVLAVLFEDLVAQMNTSASSMSWVSAINCFTANIIGPIVTIIINNFSCRMTVFIGGVLTSLGFFLSSFAEKVEILMFTYGVLTGSGICFSFTPLQVVLSEYFVKYYGITLGILTASYALSKSLSAPLIQLILQKYGISGTFLIMSGFILNTCVGAAFFQPSRWHLVLKSNHVEEEGPAKVDKELEEKNRADMADGKKDTASPNHATIRRIRANSLSLLRVRDARSSSILVGSSLDIYGSMRLINGRSKEEKGETDPTKEPADAETPNSFWRKFRSAVSSSIDHSLLREPLFYLICTQNVLVTTSAIYTSLFLFPFGTDAGLLPMESAGFVSARSIGEIFGRLMGPISLVAFNLPTLPTFLVLIVIHGICLAVLSQMSSLTVLYAMGGAAGFVFGTVIGIHGVILVEMMGSKRLASVLGLSAFFQSFVLLACGPFMGWTKDFTGTYRTCLMFLSIVQFLIAALWIVKPFLKVKEDLDD